jgi:hypothetical protein
MTIGKSDTGNASAAAVAPATDFGETFSRWFDQKAEGREDIKLTRDGVSLRIVGITPAGKAQVEVPGGNYDYVPLSAEMLDELMPQLFVAV